MDDVKNIIITAEELPAAIEAMLFISGDGITASEMSDIVNVPVKDIEAVLSDLMNRYEQNPWSGITIRKADDTYAMMTKPSVRKVIDQMFSPRNSVPLSSASYETLAVIAYNQPCTRAAVETVRGVSSDSIITRLLDRGWIEEAGTLDAPGRPALFRTSKQFLTEFGISSADELPSMELMSYQTIRDLENSLRKAAGAEDKQITIDNIIEKNVEPQEEEPDGNEENKEDN